MHSNQQLVGDKDVSKSDGRAVSNVPAPAQSPVTSQSLYATDQRPPQNRQNPVTSFLLEARRQVPPNLPSLLLQQQNEQLTQQGFLRGIGRDTAAMAFRRQQEQLLATRMLLQQQHLDDFLTAGSNHSRVSNPDASPFNLLATAATGRSGFDQSQALVMSSQGFLFPKGLLPSGRAGLTNLEEKNESLEKSGSPSDTLKAADLSSDEEEEEEQQQQQDQEGEDEIAKSDEKDEDRKMPAISGITENFPVKLYRMIEEAEKEGKDDIISFLSHGRAFAIHKPRQFVSEIMPKYFTTTRMSSFQRQLNLYGFRRITEGSDKGGYFHEFFLKGIKKLCKKIKRKKTSVKPPPNLFGGLGIPQLASGLTTPYSLHQELLTQQFLSGEQGREGLNAASSFGRNLLGQQSIMTGSILGSQGWAGLNPNTGSSQIATNRPVTSRFEEQPMISSQLLLQRLQQEQLMEELERQRRLRRGHG